MLSLPDLKFFRYKNGRIAYREKGIGQTLFLLHGMNGTSQSWAFLFESLATSFHIVAWDAPGFGASDIFGDGIEDFKNAASALMDNLELQKPIVIGHSMGGVIALPLAVDQYTSIVGLVLSSTHLGFGHTKGSKLMPRYADRIEHMNSKGIDLAYGEERAKRSTPPATSDNVIQFLAEIAAGSRIEGIRDGGRMSQETNNRDVCANLNVPVLILSGGKDKVISNDMHTELINALPKAQQYIFPDAGHASYAEYPHLFNKLVKDFALKAQR